MTTPFSQELRFRLLRLKKAICERFNESHWQELGLYVGCTEIIDREDRLYRSLTFNDPDYPGHVISVLEKIAKFDVTKIDEIEKYVLSNFSIEELGDVYLDGIICNPIAFTPPNEKQNPNLIALMIPFSADFNPVVASIKQTAEECGMSCVRANDIWEDSTIIQDIFSLIYRARIVICDLSGKNPNVFYEAGIAHTLGRPVIPLAQSVADIPFDLRHHRHLLYLPNQQGLSEMQVDLASRIKTILAKE